MGRLPTILAAILLGQAPTGIAAAQDDPTRPTAMIVQFPAGGATHTLACFPAEQMRPILSQPVIENVGGAAGGLHAPGERWWRAIIKASNIKVD